MESPRTESTMSAKSEPATPIKITTKPESEPGTPIKVTTTPDLKDNVDVMNCNTLESDEGFSDMDERPLNKPENIQNCPKYLLTTMIPTCLADCKKAYEQNGNVLTKMERRKLTSAIINYFRVNKLPLKNKIATDMAKQIKRHFPTEKKRDWYKHKNGSSRARLHRRYCNYLRRKQIKIFNLPIPHRPWLQVENALDPNEFAKCDDVLVGPDCPYPECHGEDGKVALDPEEFVKCDDGDDGPEPDEPEDRLERFDNGMWRVQFWLEDVVKCGNVMNAIDVWKDKWMFRREQLEQLQSGDTQQLETYLAEWADYKGTNSRQLLSYDFEQMYPGKVEFYNEQLSHFNAYIFSYMAAHLKGGRFMKFLEQYAREMITFNRDKNFTFLYMMHDIMHPQSCYNTIEHWRPYSTAESERATMRIVQNESEVDSYNEWHPCIFVLLGKTQGSNRYIVAWRDVRYHLPLGEALLAAIQLYLLFKLKYPPPCANFWQFVRSYFLHIVLPQDIFYVRLESLKHYIEALNTIPLSPLPSPPPPLPPMPYFLRTKFDKAFNNNLKKF